MMSILGGDRKISIGRELTKKHEEFIRATLSEAAALDEDTLIGEMVLVVEGNKQKEIQKDDSSLLISLKEKLKTMKSKEAIAATAKELSLPKNEIYDFYLKNFKK